MLILAGSVLEEEFPEIAQASHLFEKWEKHLIDFIAQVKIKGETHLIITK
jgi:hypothetical protein